MIYNELSLFFQIYEAPCTFFEEFCIALDQQEKYTLTKLKTVMGRFISQRILFTFKPR
jgi:hypothetical protein